MRTWSAPARQAAPFPNSLPLGRHYHLGAARRSPSTRPFKPGLLKRLMRHCFFRCLPYRRSAPARHIVRHPPPRCGASLPPDGKAPGSRVIVPGQNLSDLSFIGATVPRLSCRPIVIGPGSAARAAHGAKGRALHLEHPCLLGVIAGMPRAIPAGNEPVVFLVVSVATCS